MRALLLTGALALLGAVRGAAAEEFVPGHVFVTVFKGEGCDFGGLEAVLEIDPVTGETSIFADSDDGICNASGLEFTPDGTHLRLLNAGHLLPFDFGWVQEFAGDGTSTVPLDASDGLQRAFGYDALDYDEAGNFYVVNAWNDIILRFPVGGRPGEVFADETDGIYGRGSLAFDPVSGDLFYAGDLDGVILRITPQGEASVFDIPLDGIEAPLNVVFDRAGNLFVATEHYDWPDNPGRAIHRYDGTDPESGRLLVSGFTMDSSGPAAMTISADDTQLYFAAIHTSEGGRLYGVDTMDGTTTLLADFSVFSDNGVFPTGIAVYSPAPPAGDLDSDGDIDFIDFALFQRCFTGADAGPVAPACGSADLDNDSDVDLDDFAAFQAELMRRP